VWKLDPGRRDQIRASLTRSYRAPSLQDLISRPAISSRYAPPGPNVATSPDRLGNPGLRPELATGIEVAYEKYLPEGGVFSANLFHRRITDLIRNVTELEVVSYAAVPRWVSRPQNLDSARVTGLELEAKFRLDELIADAPQVSVRSNLSLFRSHVEGIPGPDNRIDRQPKATGNLGADYRLRSVPVQVGGSIHWVPAYRLQTTETQSSINSARRTIDLYALWTIDRNTRLRFSASNVLPREVRQLERDRHRPDDPERREQRPDLDRVDGAAGDESLRCKFTKGEAPASGASAAATAPTPSPRRG
jgi:iron complex outermembrane receptor protein